MKAIRIHAYGGSDQLKVEDTPRPTLGKDQILVKVRAAGVNPMDWKIRAGQAKAFASVSFPHTLGQDFAGDVVEVGADVRGYAPGDKVFGFASGAYAEFVAVSPDMVARMPASIDYATAAAIPTPGSTALQAIDAARVAKDQRILIHGAAGGVGSFAVQLAQSKGARVIATASRDDAEYLKRMGVEQVIDYESERFEDAVRDVDAVIDLVGGDTLARSYGVVKKGGANVTMVGPLDQAEAQKRGVRGTQLVMRRDASVLAQLASLVERGALKPRVGQIVPLGDARKAQDLNQSGHSHGKIVLKVA